MLNIFKSLPDDTLTQNFIHGFTIVVTISLCLSLLGVFILTK